MDSYTYYSLLSSNYYFYSFIPLPIEGRSTRLPYGGGVAVELIIKTKQRVFKKEGRRKIFFLSLNINKLGMLNKFVFFSSLKYRTRP
jgi:hypothetical protein